MNIGIIGSGSVGGTLGKRWASLGHQVVFASRRPGSAEMKRLVATAGGNSRSASVEEATESSQIILLATPWAATPEALASAGPLGGKILIDATNPLAPNLAGLELGTTTSGGETVALWADGARVVKAFNTVGFSIMSNPRFVSASGVERGAALFYCGDDIAAKQIVRQLAEELGFQPHDAGPLRMARQLEPFALLWISLALVQGYGREIAFDLMRR